MFVIGERLNGMFKNVRKAIEESDKTVIQELARSQVEAGAYSLDLNVGPAKVDPVKAMLWLIDTVREVTDVPLTIDSPKWDVQKEVIPQSGDQPIINSSKADPEELDKYVGLAVENNASLVALTLDQQGVPADVERRVELGAQIGAMAMEGGLPMDRLFIDPIILPVNVAPKEPENVLGAPTPHTRIVQRVSKLRPAPVD